MNADIDCTGLRCPEPVMRTRQALASAGGSFTVLVDNETARDNVRRFAESSGCGVEVSPAPGGFLLAITPGEREPAGKEIVPVCEAGAAKTVLLLASDSLGRGEPELGRILMRSFLYAASQADSPPAAAVFMNSGVRLVTEDTEAAGHISRLEERGADILVCGTCLDYYGLKDSLMVGRVSNMYEIQEMLVGAGKLVSL